MSTSDILDNLLVFVLASFLGLELIRHVSRLSHTPLMSLTNAISSVSFVAALIVASHASHSPLVLSLALIALGCAATNTIGGFMITERILKMFKKQEKKP